MSSWTHSESPDGGGKGGGTGLMPAVSTRTCSGSSPWFRMGEAEMRCLLAAVALIHPQSLASMQEGRVDQEARLLGSQGQATRRLRQFQEAGQKQQPYTHSYCLCPNLRQDPRVPWQSSWSQMDSPPALVIIKNNLLFLVVTDIEDECCCIC